LRQGIITSYFKLQYIDKIINFIDEHFRLWNQLNILSLEMQRKRNIDEAVKMFENIILQLDETDASYLMQRFSDFDNEIFHKNFFQSTDLKSRYVGGKYYFIYLAQMSKLFLNILSDKMKEVKSFLAL
jgi:hypothetical protein